ncbi:MAG: YfiR family protein [Gammaproteobacteria bacterium]|nr:YfiR family protein [Gammaproteobacteria bacterium]
MVLSHIPAQLAAAEIAEEYKVKAAFIFKMAKFIEWPANSHTDFGLCVLGDDRFGKEFDDFESRKISSLNIKVRRYNQSASVDKGCNILYISESKRPFLSEILDEFKSYPVVTISDMRDFAERGGMIELTSGKKLGFIVNLKSATKAGIKIAAPLLQLATVIK